MEIIRYPNPVLTTPAGAVADLSALPAIFSEMEETLRASGGIGLAAPQVGLPMRVLIVDRGLIESKDSQQPRHDYIRMANPVIVDRSEETAVESEGCLSFPNLKVMVERPIAIVARYEAEDGVSETIAASGLLARCIQHEIDHVDGKTMIDRLDPRGKAEAMMSYRGQVPSF